MREIERCQSLQCGEGRHGTELIILYVKYHICFARQLIDTVKLQFHESCCRVELRGQRRERIVAQTQLGECRQQEKVTRSCQAVIAKSEDGTYADRVAILLHDRSTTVSSANASGKGNGPSATIGVSPPLQGETHHTQSLPAGCCSSSE